MAITNSVATVLPGFGTPTTYASGAADLTTTTTTTVDLPASVRSGMLRLKWSGPDALTIASFQATMTDDTTPFEILPTTGVTAAGDSAEILVPFILDTACNEVDVTLTLTGDATTGHLDIEVAGNP